LLLLGGVLSAGTGVSGGGGCGGPAAISPPWSSHLGGEGRDGSVRGGSDGHLPRRVGHAHPHRCDAGEDVSAVRVSYGEDKYFI
jgi:hypothetical protein